VHPVEAAELAAEERLAACVAAMRLLANEYDPAT